MVRVGFTRSFVLLGFLFMVMHGMISSLAQARQGFRSNKSDLVLPVHKELHGSNLPAPGKGKTGIDGRKMMMHYEAPRNDGDEKKRVQNGETYPGTSSGNDGHLSKAYIKTAGVPSNNQSGVGISRSEGVFHPPMRDTSDQASSDCRSPMSEQRFSRGSSPALDPRHPRHHQTNPMEAEERRPDESTEDEIANLMRKDYRGPPNGRSKPPINNHQPSN